MPDNKADFFDSKIVQESLSEIQEMQMEILLFASYAEYAPISEHRSHIETLTTLLEKQKNMYYRMALSKDPGARAMMSEVEEHFRDNGYTVTPGAAFDVFDRVKTDILTGLEELEKEIEDEDQGPGKFLF